MIKRGKLGKFLAAVSAALACVLVFSLAACTDPEEGDKGALTLNKNTATVNVEETTTISVTSSTTETIEWSVNLPQIATVEGSGTGNKLCTITGVSAGTAVVTAKAGDKTATCSVTVNPKQGGGEGETGDDTVTIKLNGEAVGTEVIYMHVNDGLNFTADAPEGSTVTWETSNLAVASVVSTTGAVVGESEGTAIITAKVSDTVKASVTVEVLAPKTISFNDNAVDGWSYWNGIVYGYPNGDGSVSSAVYYDNGDAKITYTVTTTYAPYTVQLRYNTAEYTGTSHNVTLTVVAPKAGKIHINGEDVDVVVGDNVITVENYVEQGLYVQFGAKEGTEDDFILGENLTFEFKNVTFTSNVTVDLVAPSFAIDSDTKVITITDTDNEAENVEKYELGFFADETATEPVNTVVVTKNTAVDASSVPNGTYTVRIRAVNSDGTIRNSAWSTVSDSFVIASENTVINDSTTSGWYYWKECSLDNAYVDAEGVIHIENLGAQSNPYSFQLMHDLDKTVTGVKFTIHAAKAGYIAVGNADGSKAEREVAADTDVDIEITGLNISGKIVFCFGNNVSAWSGSALSALSGDITISNLQLTYAD